MFFQEDSPASLSASPGSDRARRTTDISGRRCLESLARFDLVGSWVKMFSGFLIGTGEWYSDRCSLTWKLRGTRFGRMYCQLRVSERRTAEIGYGLLPTPDASLATGGKVQKPDVSITGKAPNGEKRQMSLADYARRGLLPTPTAANASQGLESKDGRGNPLLPMAARMMLPTPTATSDAKGGSTRSDPKMQNSTLAHAVHGIIGTPGKSSQLNPRFVGEMMGYPPDWTALPFQAGEGKV